MISNNNDYFHDFIGTSLTLTAKNIVQYNNNKTLEFVSLYKIHYIDNN